jgi:mannosyltransferase
MSVGNPETLRLENQSRNRFGLPSLVLCALAAILILSSIFISSDAYTRVLTGYTRDLAWGPTLFRSLLAFHGSLLLVAGIIFRPSTRRNEPTVSTHSHATDRRTLVAMIALTAVALALRLWQLSTGLWIDEILTLVGFVRHPLGEIVTSFPSQNQHMLYSVLARLSFDIFGESIWALRLPSVLFGIGSIWALYFLGRAILGTKEALLAATLMTFSYHHIWFSQNARGYTGLLLATLIATWAWIRTLRDQSVKWWIIYGVATIAGMLIHMTMAFVVAAHVIAYVIFAAHSKWSNDGQSEVSAERRSGWTPFFVWVLSATVTLQLYALSLPEFLTVGLHEESRDSEWTNPLWVIRESLDNLSIGFAGISVVALGMALVILGWTSIFQRDRRVALIIALPAVMSGAFMLLLGHNLFPRFFFFSMGFGLLIVIHGAIELPKFLTNFLRSDSFNATFLNRAGVAVACLMIVASLVTIPRNYMLPKQDFVGAKAFVENQDRGSEKVVGVGLAGDMYSQYFAPEWRVTNDPQELKRLQLNGASWLVYTLPFQIESFHPELWANIQTNYQVVQRFPGTLNGGDVVVCRYKSATSQIHE